MGRLLLLIRAAPLLLAAAACEVAVSQTVGTGTGEAQDAHADQPCVSCHRGDQAELGEAAVPGAACAASGCHSDGGPVEIVLSTVDFHHRDHGGDSIQVAMSCAGCHSHRAGDEPIIAGTDACTLCHSEKLRGEQASDCRFCHTRPTFEGVTSQGLAIPHETLPWIQGECVRCHYDVAEPPRRVSSTTCSACHADRSRITAAGIGEDLHPDHAGVGCTGCHAAGEHHIVAMSSAVDLECSQCHLQVHGVDVDRSFPQPATCNACHRGVHRAQQRLVLGVFPDIDATPSEKFLDGLTCRSCHATPEQVPGGRTAEATSASCTGCHRPEFATVLRWWREGTNQRRTLTERYVGTAERALAGTTSDSARTLLATARELLDDVERGGGEHNLPLTHRVLSASLDRTATAYEVVGRTAPAVPDLGRQPRMGVCSYCHYRTEEQQLRTLTAAQVRFHQDVLGVREMSRSQGGE